MEMMTWSESLAAAAANWVSKCNRRHALTPLPGTNFMEYGQQDSVIMRGRIDFANAVQKWYEKKDWYDYDTMQCSGGGKCHRYAQVVWATSVQIGCAYHYCDIETYDFDDAEFFACNYLPAGNEPGQKPFKKGPACSQCRPGTGWCKNGLCNGQCLKAGKDCTCAAICRNCGRLDLKTCKCSCPDGWHGVQCEERCEEKGPQCAEWKPHLCIHARYSDRIKKHCPVKCKLCKPNPNAKAGQCQPVYAPARPNSTDNNGCEHQQHYFTLTLLSNVILSLTISWKALF